MFYFAENIDRVQTQTDWNSSSIMFSIGIIYYYNISNYNSFLAHQKCFYIWKILALALEPTLIHGEKLFAQVELISVGVQLKYMLKTI